MRGFHYRKKSETLKSMLPFKNFDITSIKRKSKKKIKSHSRNTSFKSIDCQFKDITTLFGYRKNSLLARNTTKRDKDDAHRFMKSKKKSRSKLKFSAGDNQQFMSKVHKYSSTDTDRQSYRKHFFSAVNDYCESIVNFTKSDFKEMLKLIFDFFGKFDKKKKSFGTQTEEVNMEEMKLQAKRLIINSDMKMPEDKVRNNMLLLCQKEILLDEILAILNEEDIDLNNLLSITLERIEANHFDPPTDVSLVSGLSLVLEDKLKMPTPKWQDCGLKSRLKIDLTNILSTENNTSSKKGKKSSKFEIKSRLVTKGDQMEESDSSRFDLRIAKEILDKKPQSRNKSTDCTKNKKKCTKINNLKVHVISNVDDQDLKSIGNKIKKVKDKEESKLNVSPIHFRGEDYEDEDVGHDDRLIDFGFGQNDNMDQEPFSTINRSELQEGWSI